MSGCVDNVEMRGWTSSVVPVEGQDRAAFCGKERDEGMVNSLFSKCEIEAIKVHGTEGRYWLVPT